MKELNRCPLCGGAANAKIGSEGGKWSTTTSLPELGGGSSSLFCFDQSISVPPVYPSVANAIPTTAVAPDPAIALHLEGEAANMSNHINTQLVGPLPLPHF